MPETQKPLIVIDVDAVLKQRVPGLWRWLPRFVIRGVERLIHQDGLNWLLRSNYPKRGVEFCEGVFDNLKVTTELVNTDRLPAAENRRVTYICNHPLGALDGMALIAAVGRHHGCEPYFVVNDLLSAVEPLSDVFIPINKHGAQSRQAAERLEEAFASDRPMIVFPAGMVSRKGKGGVIADLKWNKMFVGKCLKNSRDVIPVFFGGKNSQFFYNFARIRTKLGIKFNYEMVLLPSEVFKSQGKHYKIHIGQQIPIEEISNMSTSETLEKVRKAVYAMSEDGDNKL